MYNHNNGKLSIIMILNDKTLVVFDIEVFKNFFCCSFRNTETKEIHTFEISNRKDTTKDFIRFFKQNFYFVGYNNIHFDNPIVNYIIEFFYNDKYTVEQKTSSIFNLSQIIINSDDQEQWKRWKWARNFESIDLLTMMFSQNLRVSLKELQVTLMYPKVQEFVVDWTKPLDYAKFDDVIYYNHNDILSTEALIYYQDSTGKYTIQNDLKLRLDIKKEYGIECLSKDGVGIGTEILKKKYLEATGLSWADIKDLRSPAPYIALNDVILQNITYNTPQLQSLLNELKTKVVSPGRKGLEIQFVYEGVMISVGVGGIHSINRPEIIKPAEDEVLLDTDAR